MVVNGGLSIWSRIILDDATVTCTYAQPECCTKITLINSQHLLLLKDQQKTVKDCGFCGLWFIKQYI